MRKIVVLLVFLATISVGLGFSETERPVVEPEALAQEIHLLINEERQRLRLKPLDFDVTLASIAKDHSIDMGRKNYFDHVNKAGEDPTQRAGKKGYVCRKDFGNYSAEGVGENIYQNNLYDSLSTKSVEGRVVERTYHWNSVEEIARTTVEGWLLSPPHRENIVNPLYGSEGIGISITPDYKVYITQNFC